MTRQIIQVSTASYVHDKKPVSYIIALCNDGTIWGMAHGKGEPWIRLKDIPPASPEGEIGK